ncbi:hypothetical protein ACROYT_G029503 [Oculina patagonica]
METGEQQKINLQEIRLTLAEYCTERYPPFEQLGPGRSCSEHIFNLRQIPEQSKEWNTTLYANFIELEKAFDSIHRDSLWKILRHYGIAIKAGKLVNVIKMLYNDCKSQVICNTVLTDTFNVTTGVKQGCILSPFLFFLGINRTMRQVTEQKTRDQMDAN